MSADATAPVIAIDGPTASGKGTIAAGVADRLGFHYLDSGSLYRLVSLKARSGAVSLEDEPALAAIAASLQPEFAGGRIRLDDEDVTDSIREESVGAAASGLRSSPAVRDGAGADPAPVPCAAGPGCRRPRHGHRDLPGCPVEDIPDGRCPVTRRPAA